MIPIIRQNPLYNKHNSLSIIFIYNSLCVHMHVLCMDICWEHCSAQAHKTAVFHSWVLRQQYFNRMNIWTLSLPNDLRAVKDIAESSNCKKYIGFRRGKAFRRLCFKTMLGERKIEGNNHIGGQGAITILEARVQSWKCGEKLKFSFSVYQIYSRCCRKMQLQEGLGHVLGQGCNPVIFFWSHLLPLPIPQVPALCKVKRDISHPTHDVFPTP